MVQTSINRWSDVSSETQQQRVNMEFEFDDQDLTFSIDYSVTQKQSAFDLLLKKQWTEAAESGVCRYQLPDLNTAVLPGKYGFVIQVSQTNLIYSFNSNISF